MKNIPDGTMISLNERRKKKDDECEEEERKKGEKKENPIQCNVLYPSPNKKAQK